MGGLFRNFLKIINIWENGKKNHERKFWSSRDQNIPISQI
jgi:hypothetical protein